MAKIQRVPSAGRFAKKASGKPKQQFPTGAKKNRRPPWGMTNSAKNTNNK